jgi:hypothetical protein
MSINDDSLVPVEDKTPAVSPGTYTYSPVTVYMRDTIGAVVLGVLTIVLLIGWIRSEERCRSLLIRK